MQHFFTILGGMGTLATESFVHKVNSSIQAKNDQGYLNYLVMNDASIPDRTAFIRDEKQADPFPALAQDVLQATNMGTSFIVIACNTAHYFYDRLQDLTQVPIIHMPRTAIDWTSEHYPPSQNPRIGFLGTEGTRAAKIYQSIAKAADFELVEPQQTLQNKVNQLIYEDVKTGHLDRDHYESVLQEMLDEYSCNTILLGCTELSVLNDAFPMPELPLVDAQAITVEHIVKMAKIEQHK